MRCPKCGRMGFDCLDACSKCGRDLHEVRTALGDPPRPNRDLCWFGPKKASPSGPPFSPEALPKGDRGLADLTGIEVSDLMPARAEAEELVEEIDLVALEEAAEDAGFQQALDQVLDKRPHAA